MSGAIAHFMENGNFLCGFVGGGMVFEAETEEEVSCPACKAVLEQRKRKRRTSLYMDEEND